MSVPLQEWLHSVSWLSGLPSNWSVRRFKDIASLSAHDNTAHDNRLLSLSTSRGIVPKEYDDENRIRSGEDLRRYWKVVSGQVIVNPMWLAHGSVAAADTHGVISPDYRVYNTVNEVDPHYLALLLRTNEYRGLYELFVRGSTTYDRRVSKDDFHSIPVIVPPLDQQKVIASYLARKTASIDSLIEKKKRLIELLQEERQAFISQAVTQGLDPSVPMKQSGIEWLAAVPQHWRTSRLKHLVTRIVDCPHTTPECIEDGEYYAIRTADIDWGRLLLDRARRVSEETYRERTARLVPEEGDVLYSREGERFGMAALVPRGVRLCLGQRMMMFRPSGRLVLGAFLNWFLNSTAAYKQVVQDTTGSTAPRVNIPTVANLWVAVPPLPEQERIATALSRFVLHIDSTTDAIAAHIEKLHEYRRALITAAVTGKLDVSREAA